MPKGVLYYIVYTVPSDSNQVKMAMFLDRHHAWQSLDPTLDIWSNFVKRKEKKRKKKAFYLFFLLHPFKAKLWVTMGSQRFP